MYLNSFVFTHFFELFTSIWDVWNNNVALVLVLSVVLLLLGGWWVVGMLLGLDEPVVPLVLNAQEGNWQCLSAVLMWSSSLSKLSCVEETVFALCARVFKTLCLAVMWWLLSQCRYWSVWVGFLYTVVLRVLSGWMDESVQERK